MPEPISTRVGHALVRVLGLDLGPAEPPVRDDNGPFSYVEHEPTATDWVHSHTPTAPQIRRYFVNMFPFLQWIVFYNTQWLIGDLVAGITVGAVVIPQSMAYAELAKLPPEYGLYSSFMGALVYWFFATSKDITIEPVAVMSTLVGSILIRVQAVHPEIPGPTIASALAIICGAIVAFLGFLRLGFIVDFISLGELPAAVIVLLIEHIAISKSFGREFIAIGISNLLGPFLGAYPATGSFSRTAIKAKCGVRTPLTGVITAIVVLLAIYALPALFFYIPKSSLSAVIMR
ncbi:hypothetical protein PENANT_c001G10823 [Penicillium antarcticum]|uniref:SLC26A/SulP transporter domain-containing protein n=1 Tax=Penicillium antarcticum TaxID=416450 RepID=A0A1V6QPB6_9EURO|nr:hypothetical protein PENANT_c001G10823 [Penicillium antarcticum]